MMELANLEDVRLGFCLAVNIPITDKIYTWTFWLPKEFLKQIMEVIQINGINFYQMIFFAVYTAKNVM